jgi:hypothetical protein
VLSLRRDTRLKDEIGQVLILVVLMLPLFFAVVAVVTDGSTLLTNRRSVQNAADSAALAAAQDLADAAACNGDATCLADLRAKVVADLEAYMQKNGGPDHLDGGTGSDPAQCFKPSDTNCYTWPYKGSWDLVEVRLRKDVKTFFTKAIGISKTFTVSARSVASTDPVVQTSTTTIPGTTNPGTVYNGSSYPGTTNSGSTVYGTTTNYITSTETTITGTLYPLSLFAYTHLGTDACSTSAGIVITGNSSTSIDGVESNGNVNLGVSSNNKFQGTVGWAGYGPPAKNCPLNTTNSTGSVSSSTRLPAIQDWPRTFDRTAICTGHDSALPRVLVDPADGIYCSSVSITLNTLGGGSTTKSHNLTIVAPIITIPSNENRFALNPYITSGPNHDLTLWQYGNNVDFVFNHNNALVNGVIWIQNGDLTFTGNSGTTGFYEAQNVFVTGNSYAMHGQGPNVGGTPTTTTIVTPTVSSTPTTIAGTTVAGVTTPNTTVAGTTVAGHTTTSSTTLGRTIGLGE